MNKLKKELKRFIVAGISAVSTDLITYYILLNFLPHSVSKTISFLLGTVVAFVINKYWTFEKHTKSYTEVAKFGFLYLVTLGANVFANAVVLKYFSLVFLAFLVATGVSTILNFLGQKFWVFK